MKTQVVSISKLQTSKVMALMYLVISLPLALIALVPALVGKQPIQWGMLVLMPLLYTAMGFVFTFVGAWIYNCVAERIGGIEFETALVERE